MFTFTAEQYAFIVKNNIHYNGGHLSLYDAMI